MLDPNEYELEERGHMIDVLQFGAGAVVVAIGVVMMLTAALMPVGLIVFALGMFWLMVAAFLHHTGAEDIHPSKTPRPISNLFEQDGPH